MLLLDNTHAGKTRSNIPVSINRRSWQSRDLLIWIPFNLASNSVIQDKITGAGTSGAGGTGWTTECKDAGLEANTQGVGTIYYPDYTNAYPGGTVSIWFRPSWAAGSATSDYISQWGPNGSLPDGVYHTSDGSTYESYYWYDNTGGGYTAISLSLSGYAAGDLCHLAIVHFGDALNSGYGFFNGTEGSAAGNTTAKTRNIGLMSLGADASLAFATAINILDFRIYNRPLTKQECLELYYENTRWDLYDFGPRLWIPGVGTAGGNVYNETVSLTSTAGFNDSGPVAARNSIGFTGTATQTQAAIGVFSSNISAAVTAAMNLGNTATVISGESLAVTAGLTPAGLATMLGATSYGSTAALGLSNTHRLVGAVVFPTTSAMALNSIASLLNTISFNVTANILFNAGATIYNELVTLAATGNIAFSNSLSAIGNVTLGATAGFTLGNLLSAVGSLNLSITAALVLDGVVPGSGGGTLPYYVVYIWERTA